MRMTPAALLFDMYGTLTEARGPISDEMVETLQSVRTGITKHLVTGSDMSKIEEQIPIPMIEKFLT